MQDSEYLSSKIVSSKPYSNCSNNDLLKLLLASIGQDKAAQVLITEELLKTFGNMHMLFTAGIERLSVIEQIDHSVVNIILLIQEIIDRILKSKCINNSNIINSLQELTNYLQYNMSDVKAENFRVLFLNKKNVLVCDKVVHTGTVDKIVIYTRDIVRCALLCHASAIISVHNRPNRNVEPSKSDVTLINDVIKACKLFNIKVHDHIIISYDEFFSFKHFNMLN